MPDCRSANAVINPPIPAPTITARILSSFRSKRTHRFPTRGGSKVDVACTDGSRLAADGPAMKQLLAWTGSAGSTITSETVAMAEKLNTGQESACRSPARVELCIISMLDPRRQDRHRLSWTGSSATVPVYSYRGNSAWPCGFILRGARLCTAEAWTL